MSCPEETCKLQLVVRATDGKGRGVFTERAIAKGQLVHLSHCIRVPAHEYEQHVKMTVFENYLFHGSDGDMLLAISIASLFNHSDCPNLDYRVDKSAQMITFKAARHIKEGEELTFCYGSKLWFKDANDRASDACLPRETLVHEHMDREDMFLGSMTL